MPFIFRSSSIRSIGVWLQNLQRRFAAVGLRDLKPFQFQNLLQGFAHGQLVVDDQDVRNETGEYASVLAIGIDLRRVHRLYLHSTD